MTIREFLGLKVSCEYITILNEKELDKTLWQGEYETIDNQIPCWLANSTMIKWSVKNDGIVLWFNI